MLSKISRPSAVVLSFVTAAALLLTSCTRGDDTPPPAAPTTAVATPSATPTPSPTPTETEAPDPLPDGAVNALLIGTDSRDPKSLGGQADTIMLAHLTADRSKLYLISFTRDMWVKIPGLGEGKINSAFARGGTPTLKATVEQLLGGIEIDYTVQSNFAGFIALTRALDGFTVDNKYHSTVTVNSTGRVVDFPEGKIELRGTDGLIYVRERKRLPLGDLDRTERQRAAVTGMLKRIAERIDEPAVLAELIPMLAKNVKITGDLSVSDFIDLVPLASNLDGEVVGLMVPITGFGNRNGASVNEVDTMQTKALGEALRSDSLEEYVEEFGLDYAPTRR